MDNQLVIIIILSIVCLIISYMRNNREYYSNNAEKYYPYCNCKGKHSAMCKSRTMRGSFCK